MTLPSDAWNQFARNAHLRAAARMAERLAELENSPFPWSGQQSAYANNATTGADYPTPPDGPRENCRVRGVTSER